jgi:hypothetical protein
MGQTQLQLRRDTGTNWASENPILAEGEIGIVMDSTPKKIKIGDGITAWNSLSYFAITAESDPVFLASEAASFVSGDKSKLNGIEAGANVTDIDNVGAAHHGAMSDE